MDLFSLDPRDGGCRHRQLWMQEERLIWTVEETPKQIFFKDPPIHRQGEIDLPDRATPPGYRLDRHTGELTGTVNIFMYKRFRIQFTFPPDGAYEDKRMVCLDWEYEWSNMGRHGKKARSAADWDSAEGFLRVTILGAPFDKNCIV